MKKSIIVMVIIVSTIWMVSCDKRQSENKNNIELENLEASEEEVLTKEDIRKLTKEGSDTMFITKKGEDIVSGNIVIKNNFDGELTIISSKDTEKILSLYVDNKQVNFNLEGKNEISHKVNLKKGENIFNVQISENLINKINSCVMVLSNNSIESKRDNPSYIPFNIINESIKDTNIEDKNNLLKEEEIISYEKINDNKSSEDGTYFEYLNLSVKDYLNENYNNVSYEIEASSKEKIEVPLILSENSVNKGANIKVILNGVEVYSKILNEDLKSTIYAPLQFKVPNKKGDYIMNLIIFDKYNNNTIMIRSDDFKLKVK